MCIRDRPLTVNSTTLTKPTNYYAAADAAAMVRGLRQAFANIALSLEGSGGSLAANTTKLETGTAVYQSMFTSGRWDGDLSAYTVDAATGNASSTASWSASTKLPAWDSRKIFVNADNASTLKAFTYGNLGGSQKTALGSAAIVDYLRGDRSNEGDKGIKLRQRGGLIGDIVNSQPVYVGAPNGALYRNSNGKFNGAGLYPAFAAAQAARTGVILSLIHI